MPVILATQEAKIRRIAVRSQPRKIVRETLSRKYLTQKKGWWRGSSFRPLIEPQLPQKKKKKKKLDKGRDYNCLVSYCLSRAAKCR
jgi:hypothetical protein